jgi:hypothetical protein
MAISSTSYRRQRGLEEDGIEYPTHVSVECYKLLQTCEMEGLPLQEVRRALVPVLSPIGRTGGSDYISYFHFVAK